MITKVKKDIVSCVLVHVCLGTCVYELCAHVDMIVVYNMRNKLQVAQYSHLKQHFLVVDYIHTLASISTKLA